MEWDGMKLLCGSLVAPIRKLQFRCRPERVPEGRKLFEEGEVLSVFELSVIS